MTTKQSVTVTYANGDKISTDINGTRKSVSEYFQIGNEFNIGSGEKDNVQKVVALDFTEDETEATEGDVKEFFRMFHEERFLWKTISSEMDRIKKEFCSKRGISIEALEKKETEYFKNLTATK